MKTAIYIEDGVVQLVITPESEFEKNAISTFEQKPLEAEIHSGSFYKCVGGWNRHSNDEDKSIMLRIVKPKENKCE